MQTVVKQIVSMLFSDVVGFSKVSDDRLYSIVKSHISNFAKTYLNSSNHCYFKTWGDGILICSFNPHDLLEIAININNWFENKNWILDGFSMQLKIRTGLHTEKINVISENGIVVDIDGKYVNAAARIEPIVTPGDIYCSDIFKRLVQDESSDFVEFIDIGERELAKQFGKLQLFQIQKKKLANRPTQASNGEAAISKINLGNIKIRKEYSDYDKDKFLQNAYNVVHDYFENGLALLEKHDSDIKCKFNLVRKDKFTCEVFVRGNIKAQCQIWIGNNFYKGINYYEGINSTDNTTNDIISVSTDGYTLSLSSMGSFGFSRNNDKQDEYEAAKQLWNRFVLILER